MTPECAPTKRTHCPFCGFQCGIVLERRDGEPVHIEGDEAFPVNKGLLCIKGANAGEMLQKSERLAVPRVRGSDGQWKDATWPYALDALAGTLARIKDRHGPDALGVVGSGALTNEKAYLLGKFTRLCLKTRHLDYNGRYCMASAGAAAMRAFGIDRGLPFPVADIAGAQAILLVGTNLADTHPPLLQYFEAMKAAGGKIIVADPRKTATARVADLHLPLVPGSDGALAIGMLFVAIQERLIDVPYIRERTVGFDAVRAHAMAYYPVRVEKLTGVPESHLRRATRMLAAADRAMVLSGRGAEQQQNGVSNVLSLIHLALALGKVGKPGCGYGTLTGQSNGQGGREHGQKSEQLPGYRHVHDEAHRRHIAQVWGVQPEAIPASGLTLVEMLEKLGAADGIRGLFVMGSNVAVSSPDRQRVEAGLAALECLAVCDTFQNETTEHAHFLLPVTQWAEEEGTVTNMEGRVLHRRRVTDPPAGVKSDIEILCELAQRLGPGDLFLFEEPRDVFEELRRASAGGLADYSGITYERLDREHGIQWPCPSTDHPGTPRLFADRFAHPDGLAHFQPLELLPPAEEPDDEYPLYFTTGRYKEQFNSGAQTRRIGPLLKARPAPLLEIHPHTARRLGLPAEGRVIVESRRGRVEFQIHVEASVRPDTVFAPFHFGGAESANTLTNPVLDPVSRMPEFKVCAVRVLPIPRAPGGQS